MMPDLNFAGSSRTAVFDAACAALEKELVTRLTLLQSRKADCQRLQEFAEFLSARGYPARAEARAMSYTSSVQLCVFVTVNDTHHYSDLFAIFTVQCIDIARNHAWDTGPDSGYELTLSDHLKISLRVTMPRPVSKPVAA